MSKFIMTCIVSLITESSLHIKDGHIDLITILNIVWSCRPEVLRRHAIEMETYQRLSFFLLLVPMVRLEGELGTLLWVYMAELALFGVIFFFGMALFFFLCCCWFALLSAVCCSLDPEGYVITKGSSWFDPVPDPLKKGDMHTKL